MPSVKETADFLAKVPLFQELKGRQLESLAKTMVSQDYEADQDIVIQGESGVGLFIIVSGGADVVHVRADGTKTVVNVLDPTDFFGELALLTEGPRTASVIATEPTQCLVLTRWNFLAVLKSDADMAISILEELAWRFRTALTVL
jgi:CRP/FNR family cyclic AMP-dependent transcriptional regulator